MPEGGPPGVGGGSFLGGGGSGPRPERPELRGDCTFSGVFVAFLVFLCFCFFVWVGFSLVSRICLPRWDLGGDFGRLLGGFWARPAPRKGQIPVGIGFSGVFVAFLVFCCFCFLVGVSLSSLCPLAPQQTRGRLTRSVVDPAARFAERKPLTGRDRETKKKEKKRKKKGEDSR